MSFQGRCEFGSQSGVLSAFVGEGRGLLLRELGALLGFRLDRFPAFLLQVGAPLFLRGPAGRGETHEGCDEQRDRADRCHDDRTVHTPPNPLPRPTPYAVTVGAERPNIGRVSGGQGRRCRACNLPARMRAASTVSSNASRVTVAARSRAE